MFGDTPLIIVEDDETLVQVMDSLASAPIIGIDTESDSFHHYQEKVCLIQVSDLERDIIIDPLAIDDLSPLGELLARPDQIKVLHGADYDVVCLKRDYGFAIVNIFDTMVAAQFLGFPKVGLADLIGRFFGHYIDKKYQRHDWSARPLEDEHLEYARGDTHWLPTLRDVLNRKLKQAGRLEAATEESHLIEQREWSGRTRHESDFLRTKQSATLDDRGLHVLRALWEYRDDQARDMDRPVFRVMPDRVLITLSARQPTTEDGLYSIVRKNSPMMRRHGPRVLAAILKGMKDNSPLPTAPKGNGSPRRRRSGGPGVDRMLGPLKDWRNAYVESNGVNPVVVASNQLLKEIARAVPRTLEELEKVEGIRQWQVRDLGEQIIGVVNGIATSDSSKPPRRRNRRRGRRSNDGATADES